ncbi:hypothetical protein [Hymenobacter persicinus]|uniref:DUF4293 family protein n=1 Tax=Hymenobacter persicinus TaxID=2025506 RepID=A0A4Q5LFE4_9BACT|nr:hypothetical protein [Hymenobacter persicinus]RYU83364.1 hypothetical protein EWM57_03500 [Hymenobacter persicinus]
MTVQKGFLLSAAFAAATLVTPFIWLKIGPAGYAYYGPNVPDIYIFGATITGKDRSFDGINLAYKSQLAIILYFVVSSLCAAIRMRRRRETLILNYINFALLLLFPVWLYLYRGGVISNSDGADLTTYPHVGLLFYALLVLLNIRISRKITALAALPISPSM